MFERNTSSQEESTDRRKEIDDTIVQSRRQCVVKPFWDKGAGFNLEFTSLYLSDIGFTELYCEKINKTPNYS